MIPHKVCNNLCISHSSTPPPPPKKKFHSDLLRPINSFSSLLIETLTLGNLMVAGRGSRVAGRGSRVAGRGSRVQCRGRGSNVAVAGPMSRSRVQSRGRGSNVAAGESDLGFEVTEWKRLIRKKYKGKKIVFMHDTLRAWLKVRDGRGTKKGKRAAALVSHVSRLRRSTLARVSSPY